MISQKREKNRSILILLVPAAIGVGIFFENLFQKKLADTIESNVDTRVTQELSANTEGSFSLKTPPTIQPSTSNFELSQNDLQQWQVIEEVLISRNDNDLRVDSELKSISANLKERIKDEYHRLPMENRNGRGFLVFLIARDMKSAKDVEFMKSVFEEKPCLSLGDCGSIAEENPHLDSINNVSLNYPQMAILFQLKRKLEAEPSVADKELLRQEIEQLLREARQFPSPGIESRVSEIEDLLRK